MNCVTAGERLVSGRLLCVGNELCISHDSLCLFISLSLMHTNVTGNVCFI